MLIPFWLLLLTLSWKGVDLEVPVPKGRTLIELARPHRLGLEHVAWANHLPVTLQGLPAGRYLIPNRRILPEEPHDGLVLNLPERGVFLFQKGHFAGFYPVAIGMPGWCTPVGQFHIAQKTVDPTWNPPAWAGVSGPVGPGPDNPLGDRWMGIGYGGYGMHGTNRPDSIGGAVSHGCIRMYPELARELFARVALGTPVRIEYRPVKVAWDPEQFEARVAVFPDVYGRCNLSQELDRVLQEKGLSDWVDISRRRQLVRDSSGCAESLVGEWVRFSWQGTETALLPAARRNGSLYCTPAFLDALGLPWEWRGRTLRVSDGSHELEVPTLRLGDEAMLSVRAVIDGLKLDCQLLKSSPEPKTP